MLLLPVSEKIKTPDKKTGWTISYGNTKSGAVSAEYNDQEETPNLDKKTGWDS